jgi:NADP-dependent 3-hydroxy acid dehydrogenase YdfG
MALLIGLLLSRRTGHLVLSSDAEALELYAKPSGARVLDPEDVAAPVIYALRQQDHTILDEILVEPATSLFRGSW